MNGWREREQTFDKGDSDSPMEGVPLWLISEPSALGQPHLAFPYVSLHKGHGWCRPIKKEMTNYCIDISIQNLYSVGARVASILLVYDAESFAQLDLEFFCRSSLHIHSSSACVGYDGGLSVDTGQPFLRSPQKCLIFCLNQLPLNLLQLPRFSWKTRCCRHHVSLQGRCWAGDEQHLLSFQNRRFEWRPKRFSVHEKRPLSVQSVTQLRLVCCSDDWPSRTFSHLQSGSLELSHRAQPLGSWSRLSTSLFPPFCWTTRCRKCSGCSTLFLLSQLWRPLCSREPSLQQKVFVSFNRSLPRSLPVSELWGQMAERHGLVSLWYDCHLWGLTQCPSNSRPHIWAHQDFQQGVKTSQREMEGPLNLS